MITATIAAKAALTEELTNHGLVAVAKGKFQNEETTFFNRTFADADAVEKFLQELDAQGLNVALTKLTKMKGAE